MERLERLYKHADAKMTQDRYLEICEQLGQEPDEREIPPHVTDLPEETQEAIKIFNMLGDRIYPDVGYIGKDYTNLPILLEVCGVEDIDLTLDVLGFLDSRAIQKSAEEMKKQMDKLKRK